MTTLAAILTLFPLALAIVEGSAMQQPWPSRSSPVSCCNFRWWYWHIAGAAVSDSPN
jgi:hypothetical protein